MGGVGWGWWEGERGSTRSKDRVDRCQDSRGGESCPPGGRPGRLSQRDIWRELWGEKKNSCQLGTGESTNLYLFPLKTSFHSFID